MFPLCLKEAELGLVCWQDTLVLMKDAVSCYLFTLKKVCFWTAAGESSSESKLWPLSFPVSFDPSLPPSMLPKQEKEYYLRLFLCVIHLLCLVMA